MKKFVIKRKDVLPNPTLQFAKEMVEKARGYDEVESIGGGSTIDVGKYVAYQLGIPHTAIPTTAGTGSEVTRYAVFIDKGKKVSLEDKRLIPENYILDPSRIVTLPPKQTASTGLDALAQGIESYWSPKATGESRHWSKLAIKFASKNLLDSYLNPNSEVLRMRMLLAANYSGRAINITRTSICHAISYPFTIHYGIPHGIACAITLPFFMRYFGFESHRVERLIARLNVFAKIEYDKDLIIKEALESTRAHNTPKPINENIIYKSLSSYDRRPIPRRTLTGYPAM